MPTYITLVDWTGEGIANVKESPRRLQQAREVFSTHGGEMTEFFMTMGQHDMVVVSQFPDDESYAKALLTVARGGSVRTETLKAFTEDEYRDVVDAL
ncbi:GYD family protein [Salinigranum rubrum]|uniref:GYD family protein n=1 Tax=Salinigranum rubrum TaxID=755307 RepID=A0A2I8VND3_9EURY|nr:GYD domain-containing protein [Salinigranum rubrum]AUV83428.1 GYD family protein [Salinigranum rubrum]